VTLAIDPGPLPALGELLLEERIASLPDGKELKYVGRREYSSPAHGSLKKHKERQSRLVREAFE